MVDNLRNNRSNSLSSNIFQLANNNHNNNNSKFSTHSTRTNFNSSSCLNNNINNKFDYKHTDLKQNKGNKFFNIENKTSNNMKISNNLTETFYKFKLNESKNSSMIANVNNNKTQAFNNNVNFNLKHNNYEHFDKKKSSNHFDELGSGSLANLNLNSTSDDKNKSISSVSYWSSNVSLRSKFEKKVNNNNNFNTDTYSVNSGDFLNKINPRPPTARSLPSKVSVQENSTGNNSSHMMNSSRNDVISNEQVNSFSAQKTKNPSCPSISSTASSNHQTNKNIINSTNSNLSSSTSKLVKSDENLNNREEQLDNDDYEDMMIEQETSSLKSNNSSSNENFIIYTPCGNNFDKISAKSNLDYFLDYAINPFTTKFEIIGSAGTSMNKTKAQLDSITVQNENNNNYNNNEQNRNTRSRSYSSLNDETTTNSSTIVSPVLINPQTLLNTNANNTKKSNTSISELSINELNINYNQNSANALVDEASKVNNFVRITENLFMGNMNCIKNERRMCKLNIEYLIDMTNMRPDDLNRKILGKIPCLCKRQQHSRLYLTVEINDTSFKSLFSAFNEVNKFIQRAKKTNTNKLMTKNNNNISSSEEKCVLIFGKDMLAPQVICACAQYLMVEYEMNIETALHIIMKKNTNNPTSFVNRTLDECYVDYLKQFDVYLKHMSMNMPQNRQNEKKYYILNNQFSTDDKYFAMKNQKLASQAATYYHKDNLSHNNESESRMKSRSSFRNSLAKQKKNNAIGLNFDAETEDDDYEEENSSSGGDARSPFDSTIDIKLENKARRRNILRKSSLKSENFSRLDDSRIIQKNKQTQARSSSTIREKGFDSTSSSKKNFKMAWM